VYRVVGSPLLPASEWQGLQGGFALRRSPLDAGSDLVFAGRRWEFVCSCRTDERFMLQGTWWLRRALTSGATSSDLHLPTLESSSTAAFRPARDRRSGCYLTTTTLRTVTARGFCNLWHGVQVRRNTRLALGELREQESLLAGFAVKPSGRKPSGEG